MVSLCVFVLSCTNFNFYCLAPPMQERRAQVGMVKKSTAMTIMRMVMVMARMTPDEQYQQLSRLMQLIEVKS